MTVFFDPTNREILKSDGATVSVPMIISEAAIRTNDADIVRAWAMIKRHMARGETLVMLPKEISATASDPVFA